MSLEDRLDAAGSRLVQIVDLAMTEAWHRGGEHLVCRPGCWECCVGPFPINQLDARRLRQGVRELRKTDPQRADSLVERARETALLFAREFPGDPSTGCLDTEEGAEETLAARFAETPCPALDPETGRCDVYTHGPVPCRTFGPPIRFGQVDVAPCRLCFTEASDVEIEASRVEVQTPVCGELLEVEHGLEQTVIAFAIAFTPDD